MNVSSSATTSTTSTTSSSSTVTVLKSQNNNGTSFDEEMKNVNTEQNQEENLTDEKQVESAKTEKTKKNEEETSSKENVLKGEVKVDTEIENQNLLSLNIQELLNTQNLMSGKFHFTNFNIFTNEDLTRNIGETLNLNVINISENDAQFFIDVVKNNNSGVQGVVQDVQQALIFGSEEIQQSANVSKTLLNAFANTVKTGQAVRIDFGNDVAVIIRIARDGAIMANFIPGDKAVEEYLKNNIDLLKNRFEEENISYSQLSYSQHREQEKRQQQQKEDKHE